MRLTETDQLRLQGIPETDIIAAIQHQEIQRQSRVPVLSLSQIVGLEAVHEANYGHPLIHAALKPICEPKPRPAHRTGRKIHGGSILAHSPAELDFIVKLTKPSRKAIVKAAYACFRKGREIAAFLRRNPHATLSLAQHRLAQFTASARDILLELLDNEEFFKGRLFPSYEKIAEWSSRARATVHRSIKLLASLGLIEWKRRYEFNPETNLSSQTSNLYRFALPDHLAQILGIEAPPVPADVEWSQANRLNEEATMYAGLNRRQLATALPQDRAARLAIASAALASASIDPFSVDGSHFNTPPRSKSLFLSERDKETPQVAGLRQP